MAGLKIIKKRIGSVKNIRKITKTMELVSAAKSRKMMVRVHDSQPYGNKMADLLGTLSGVTGELDLPLLRITDQPKKIILLVVTANRGLCGGYNAQLLKMARHRIKELQDSKIPFDLHVIGKKGLAYFKFIDVAVSKSWVDFDDNFDYTSAQSLAKEYVSGFINQDFDRLELISTRYISASVQRADLFSILPMAQSAAKGDATSPAGTTKPANIIFEPSAEDILKTLLPHMAEYIFYKTILEAVTSEQIARRIAMKAASDAAGDMNKSLTRIYNRKRQAAITQELAEIVAGADAIK